MEAEVHIFKVEKKKMKKQNLKYFSRILFGSLWQFDFLHKSKLLSLGEVLLFFFVLFLIKQAYFILAVAKL